ncbi:MAG: hypothetical protein AAB316_10435, partial [Bacteroidota bacterium]
DFAAKSTSSTLSSLSTAFVLSNNRYRCTHPNKVPAKALELSHFQQPERALCLQQRLLFCQWREAFPPALWIWRTTFSLVEDGFRAFHGYVR